MNNKLYKYNATLVKIVDGDTIDVKIDLGFHIYIVERLRFRGIDTPEMNSTDPLERENATKAKNRVIELFTGVDVFQISTFKSDKFGRYLADIYLPNQNNTLNQILLNEGLATEYK